MKRTLRTTLVGVAAVLAVAAAGCKKDEKKEAGAGPGASGGAAGASGEAALPAKTGFAVFPASSKMIAGFNFASARSSALWGMYKDRVEAAMAKDAADFKGVCGFDPFTQVQSVVAGGNPESEELVVVLRGVARDQLKSCGEKMMVKQGKKLSVTDDGSLSLYQMDDQQIWGAWLDDSTGVFTPKKDKAFVAQRAAGEAGLGEGGELMALLKNVDTGATLYFAGTADSMGAGNPASAMAPGAKGFFGSIKAADGLAVDAGIRFDTAENAKTFTGMMQSQIEADGRPHEGDREGRRRAERKRHGRAAQAQRRGREAAGRDGRTDARGVRRPAGRPGRQAPDVARSRPVSRTFSSCSTSMR